MSTHIPTHISTHMSIHVAMHMSMHMSVHIYPCVHAHVHAYVLCVRSEIDSLKNQLLSAQAHVEQSKAHAEWIFFFGAIQPSDPPGFAPNWALL